MAITWQNVVDVAPEQANPAIPAGTQTMILALVDKQIDDVAWDDLADNGRAWLAAHYGALYLRNGDQGGAISSQTLGPMSESYALPRGLAGALATTKYGIEYQRLINLLPGSLGFVV